MRIKFKIVSFLFAITISLQTFANQQVEQWSRFEISLKTSKTTDPAKVTLTATFISGNSTSTVDGFFDGYNTFKVRFMPQQTGKWNYITKSNIPELNNKKGYFECVKASPENHGMVQVSNTYNFKYADGKQFFPFGTTAYAWTHMPNDVQEMTLQTLKKSGFNKIRMCVFPKDYNLVKEEPEIYPFEIKEIKKDEKGNEVKIWNFDKFNTAFFQHLENRIDDLNKLGIEADLILFHPYDKGRWGFDDMPMEVNLKYIEYITARLASFRNVWWSMANEWDLVKTKTHSEWETLTSAVVKNDPYRHLCSIHGATATYFEYWKPEFTHVSIQDETPVQRPSVTAILRNIYQKPVICDEVGYEGNLKSRWGRYSPEEMTMLVWNGILGGGYVTHGESYMFKDANDTIFWAKGGKFKGSSWKRIAFLRQIMEDCPASLSMADISRDNYTASAGQGYYLIYFGNEMHDSWLFNLPAKNREFSKLKAGTKFKVEIIDTWEMTITTVPETFETGEENDYRLYDKNQKKVRLPYKPFIALRIIEIKK